MDMLLAGFSLVMNAYTLAIVLFGVAMGIVFGAIPGMTATMAIALFLPITYAMTPINAISLLIGLYIGGISGGLISAVLLKIPGTPSSIATTFDGHPMAARGEAGRALGIGIFYSFVGGIISLLFLITVAPAIAKVALKFTPFEYFAISLFSLTMIGSLAGDDIRKGLASGLLGIAFSLVGIAPIDGYPRFTFGMYQLSSGFNILPVLIGLFAISEYFVIAEEKRTTVFAKPAEYTMRGFGFTFQEFVQQKWNMIRSALLGTGIGILPGIGGSVSNILSYMVAKRQSKHPEKFGTGIMDGIVAPETSNNATTGGALIPLLTLGIPGDATTAMLLGALTLHGLTPGPLLFKNHGDIVYGIFVALLIANVCMLVMEYFGMRIFVKLLNIPKKTLMPIIIVLCVVGAYGLNNRVFDAAVILIFGVIGYVMMKLKFAMSPMILGFILGPIIETNFRRAVMFSRGSATPFFTRPICALFLLLTVGSIALTLYQQAKKAKLQG